MVLWLWISGFWPLWVRAYWLLPLWLGMEIYYGKLSGQSDGIAHWAHVGGFIFGALAALALRYSGLEHKANKAIEEKISLDNRSRNQSGQRPDGKWQA